VRKPGKRVGGCLYLHRDYAHLLPKEELAKALSVTHPYYRDLYTVIKYESKTGAFSFIESRDFIYAHEPSVGKSVKVHADGTCTYRSGFTPSKQIYHHKWMFVADDYPHFDVEESKERSNRIEVIIKQKGLNKRKIGWRKYWFESIIGEGLELGPSIFKQDLEKLSKKMINSNLIDFQEAAKAISKKM